MKIQVKTALLFTAVTAGIILFLSLAVYYFASRFTFNDFLKRLELRAKISARIHFEEDEISSAAFNELREQYLTPLPKEKVYILEYDSLARKLKNDTGPKLPQTFYGSVILHNGKTVYTSVKHTQYAGILFRNESNKQYLVISSAVNVYGDQVLKNLEKVLIITFIMSTIAIFTVGTFLSRRIFAPVREITRRVEDISAYNLHLRLQEGSGKDEITALAQTFNNMLDRLETSFETQNNFVSNASHELRTPLTTIIGEAEIALSKVRSEQEYKQSLQVILREAARLQHLTASLLKLAQAGFDGQKQEWGILRMDESLMNVKKTVDEIEPNNRVRISLHLPEDERLVSVQGNDQLLHLALSNIVLNACKYSDNKSVLLSLATSENKIIIAVVDEGIGIPAAEVKYIFDPFFRASNTFDYEGYGIGLPLTHTIIRLHKGDIRIQSQVGKGTTVIVSLPVARLS
jgi:signal transduction histidine kinase